MTWTAATKANGTDALRSVVGVATSGTESAPTGTAGLNLASVGAFHLAIECDEGESFSSTDGAFEAYMDVGSGVWCRAAEHDVAVTSDDTGERGLVVSFQVAAPRSRIAHVPVGISHSGGNLTLRYMASGLRGNYY